MSSEFSSKFSSIHYHVYQGHIVQNSNGNYLFSTVTYLKHEDIDCLYHSDLHIKSLSTDWDVEKCKQWCTHNSTCHGFTVSHGWVYFKGQCCKNNLFYHEGRFTFLKDEN